MYVFDFTRNVWEEFVPNDSNKETDNLPEIDSHAMLHKDGVLYIVAGFIGGEIGDYSSSVYSLNLGSKKSECLFNS